MKTKRKRGDVSRFKAHLNSLPGNHHHNGRYRQRVRKYGDYLYTQDMDRFFVELDEWLKTNS